MGEWRYKKNSKMCWERKRHSLIENNTAYSTKLSLKHNRFDDIRCISVEIYNSFNETEKNKLRSELERGEAILNEENQLYAYMYMYGNMHKAKLSSAFEALPETFDSKVNIIDWGCGQGFASMIFLEKYGNEFVNHITLIEPSKIALKRAALHCKKYNPKISLKTICKELDNLNGKDFNSSYSYITIHLFSNILDIDGYSQEYLIKLIEQTQTGKNYFVCASPYINTERVERFKSFKQYFQDEYDTFKSLFDIENSQDENDDYWNCNNNYTQNRCPTHLMFGCRKKWTRVINVFKIDM